MKTSAFLRTSLWIALASMLMATPAFAADHADSPAVQNDPAADIADLYAWMSADANTVNLVVTVPAAEFSDSIQYAIHVESAANFLAGGDTTDIICTFDSEQTASCWVGSDEFVTGDASAEAGITSDSGNVRLFAGTRNDPFFFNAAGFEAALTAAEANLGDPWTESGMVPGCYNVPNMTVMDVILPTLAGDGSGGAGTDSFAGANVSAIVLEIDKSVLNSGGDILGVWASTHMAQ